MKPKRIQRRKNSSNFKFFEKTDKKYLSYEEKV
jgi:hypothetical protein